MCPLLGGFRKIAVNHTQIDHRKRSWPKYVENLPKYFLLGGERFSTYGTSVPPCFNRPFSNSSILDCWEGRKQGRLHNRVDRKSWPPIFIGLIETSGYLTDRSQPVLRYSDSFGPYGWPKVGSNTQKSHISTCRQSNTALIKTPGVWKGTEIGRPWSCEIRSLWSNSFWVQHRRFMLKFDWNFGIFAVMSTFFFPEASKWPKSMQIWLLAKEKTVSDKNRNNCSKNIFFSSILFF